jgi:fermentation-respiration switch protein FrsA (DUF1100 family)
VATNPAPALKLIGLLAVAAVVLVGLVWLFQRRLIYFPVDEPMPPAADLLRGAEELTLHTVDGLELGAWFVPAATRRPRATVLVFNGNAGNRTFRAPLAAALSGQGFNVMLFDYRGYGGNPGRPSERGLLADARAAREALVARDDVNAERVVLFGESLGAAVALASAVERPPAALVLRSPFTSLTDVGRAHYPFLPVRWLLADRYPSIERVAGLTCPLLVIAGDRDRIVPTEQSRALYESAPGRDKRFLLLDGGHNDSALFDGDRLIRETAVFIGHALDEEDP